MGILWECFIGGSSGIYSCLLGKLKLAQNRTYKLIVTIYIKVNILSALLYIRPYNLTKKKHLEMTRGKVFVDEENKIF